MIEYPEAEDILQGLSAVMGEPARFGSPQRIEEGILSELGRLSPIEAESLASTLGNVGNFLKSDQVRGIAATALPVAARAVGTAYLGPAGGAVVGSIGDKASQAIAGKSSAQPAKPATQPAAAQAAPKPLVAEPVVAEPAPAAPAAAGAGTITAPIQHEPTGSAAAAHALTMLRHPALESSLCSLILGVFGKDSAAGTGQTEVPVGAMMVLMRELFERAAQDAESILAARQDAPPAYLLDAEGCLACDPAVPSERADALLRFLQAQRSGTAETESCGCAECAESVDDWAAAGW